MGQSISAELAAAGIAAAAAILAALMSTRTVLLQRRHATDTAEVELRRRQLNDLYGPIVMRSLVVARLRNLMPSQNPDGTPWLLGAHIEEVQSGQDEMLKDAYREMIDIGREVEHLLTSQTGLLLTFPPPPSFGQAITYSRLLRLAWTHGKNQSEEELAQHPYPVEFGRDVLASGNQIRGRLAELGALPDAGKYGDDYGVVYSPWT